MQDRPTAVELLRAARDFCEHDLIPQLTGRVRFHARVLQNVLGILEREAEHEEEAVGAEWERLRSLLSEPSQLPTGFGPLLESVRESNNELARRIRAGDLDDRWDETVDAVYATVTEKLRIANPGYSEPEASSET